MGKIAVHVFDACSEPPTASEKVKRRQHVLTIYDEETSETQLVATAYTQSLLSTFHRQYVRCIPTCCTRLDSLEHHSRCTTYSYIGGLAISIFMANHDVATPLCAPECCVQCTGLGIPPYIARLQKCIVFASAFNYLCEWKVMPCRLIKN